MAWATPIVYSVGDVLTASSWNISSNDIAFLYGDTSWTAPTLLNSWNIYSTDTVGYRKVGTHVCFRGAITGGTISGSVSAFALPVGYRPTQSVTAVTISNSAVGAVNVTTAGSVFPVTGSSTWLSLDGITFDTI